MNKLTSAGIGQCHFCQTLATGTIVQSAILPQDSWRRIRGQSYNNVLSIKINYICISFRQMECDWEWLTTVSMWGVGTEADVTGHQQVREKRLYLLHSQHSRSIVCVCTRTSLILRGWQGVQEIWRQPFKYIPSAYRYRILNWDSLLQQVNNPAATGNVNYSVDYNSLTFIVGVDTFYIRSNQVWNVRVEITNLRIVFKILNKIVIKLRSYICNDHHNDNFLHMSLV